MTVSPAGPPNGGIAPELEHRVTDWYDVFTQVEDEDVVALLDELRSPAPAS